MKRVIGCILALALSGFAYAQDNALVVSYKNEVVLKGHRLVENVEVVIQINDQPSNHYGEVSIAHATLEKFKFKEAYITNQKGVVVRRLKKSELITRNPYQGAGQHEDALVTEFAMRWNTYPYQVHYAYQRSTIFFMDVVDWSPIFYSRIPMLSAKLEVHLPIDFEGILRTSPDLAMEKDTLEDEIFISTEKELIPPFKRQTFSPHPHNELPYVKIAPENFKYAQKGTLTSWKALGIWQSRIIEGLDVLPAEKVEEIQALTEGVSDTTALISILYRYLQDNFRYYYVGLKEGGMVPFSASEVNETGYGDCKGLTIYMKSLLNVFGITSYYTLVFAGERPVRILKDFPSQQFNHVILAVPVDGDTIWLENTSTLFAANYLGTFTQNRTGLLVNGEKSHLVNLKPLSEEDVLEENSTQVVLKGEKEAIIHRRSVLRGAQYEELSYLKRYYDKETQEAFFLDNFPLYHIELDSFSIEGNTVKEHKLISHQYFHHHQFVQVLGKERLIRPIPILLPEMEKVSDRTRSISIPFPIVQKDTVDYDFTAWGKVQIQRSEDCKISTPYGFFERKTFLTEEGVRSIAELRIFRGDYPLEEYEAFYQFIESITKAEDSAFLICEID